uniref:Uncharacterized protein n=1 Tax=Rhipicephalus zambeziensis TaxID=60191 RepID=A0A224YIE4_9ACAR
MAGRQCCCHRNVRISLNLAIFLLFKVASMVSMVVTSFEEHATGWFIVGAQAHFSCLFNDVDMLPNAAGKLWQASHYFHLLHLRVKFSVSARVMPRNKIVPKSRRCHFFGSRALAFQGDTSNSTASYFSVLLEQIRQRLSVLSSLIMAMWNVIVLDTVKFQRSSILINPERWYALSNWLKVPPQRNLAVWRYCRIS